MAATVAYLINQYPKVSHSFIRTEIRALEALGVTVERFAVRGWDAEIVDPLDREERERTRYLLQGGAGILLGATLAALLGRPGRFLSALRAAWRLSRGAERGFLYHLIYLAEASLLLRWLARSGAATHVHAHFGSNAVLVALFVRMLGGPPYSFTVHGPEEFDKPLQWKLTEKIAAAAFVVAITSFCRSQLFRWARAEDWAKIAIVHCAIDPRFVDAHTTPPPANDILVCVGRLCEQKGQLLLVEAVAALHARGVRVRLVLAGDGEMRAAVEQAIAAAGIGADVTIAGWVSAEQITALLQDARALVLPSFAEGLPVAIMEAMARERPVLSTYIAGIPELVRDGVDGILIPAGDVRALSDAIARLLAATPGEIAATGASARTRVLARHAGATEAAKLAALFAGGAGGTRA
jgi:glycosyltransferase involved in cell wall biosynthesis